MSSQAGSGSEVTNQACRSWLRQKTWKFPLDGLRLHRIQNISVQFFRQGLPDDFPILNLLGGFMRKTTNRNNRAGSAFRSVSRGRVIALWAFIVAAGLVFGAVQNTAAKDDLAETAREQQMSRDAEIGSRMFEYPTEKRKLLKPSILSLGAIKDRKS